MEMKHIEHAGKPLPENFNHKKYIEKMEVEKPN
jgi:hypothetical protein